MPVDHEKLLSGLNPQQRQAVRHVEGPLLILAGAGSGKTRVITRRVGCLIATGAASPEQILAVTFTNKAAEEMRERVAEIVGTHDAQKIVISTFHSFCVRVLRTGIERLGYRKNFTISSESDTRTIIRRSLEDVDNLDESLDTGTVLEQIGAVKSGSLDLGRFPDTEKETGAKYRKWLPELYERYQSALRAANTVDFDDLLLLTLRLWREHPASLAAARKRFRFVMVDEFQDTNRVQYDLLSLLVQEHNNLCVVGDDDQSIYGWRGADISNILSFEKEFPGATVVKLEQNYRSTTTILDAANHVIANNRNRRAKNLWSALGKGRKIDWFVTAGDEEEAKEAVGWLRHIQGKSEAKYSDFAVLYRSNVQSRPFEIAFRQAGIPYVVIGGQSFFERTEIRDIVAYLRVIANPRDEASFLRVVNVPRRGIGDATLHRVHDLCRTRGLTLGKALAQVRKEEDLPDNTRTGIDQFLGLLTEFRRRFRERGEGLSLLVDDLVDQVGYQSELARTCKSADQFAARWDNVQVLMDAVAEYESNGTNGQPTLTGFLDVSSLNRDNGRANPRERQRAGVTLMTIHSAKGLEFPFVFVVGVEDGILPHEKSLREDGLEEERRLFYVALTRAQRHVTLFEALCRERSGRRRMSKTSRFCQEIPVELTARRIRAARDMVEAAVNAEQPRKPRSVRKTGSGRNTRGNRGR